VVSEQRAHKHLHRICVVVFAQVLQPRKLQDFSLSRFRPSSKRAVATRPSKFRWLHRFSRSPLRERTRRNPAHSRPEYAPPRFPDGARCPKS
jgi:hypothetical protein